MKQFILAFIILSTLNANAQPKKKSAQDKSKPTLSAEITEAENADEIIKPVKWRNIGPFRGGRSVAVSGVVHDQQTYFMGTTGGGVWKTSDAGQSWANISDGFFTTGSVGAVAVSASDPNIVWVGMGEHAPRGVMTSYGDGVYKSTDAGKTWKKMGLELTRQIAAIRIHPTNPDIIYVAAQGAINGPTKDRGIYMSTDGGGSWKNILYVDENTGCVDLSMDMTNPRILYAAMWEYHRLPWEVKSGGPGCNLYKSTDAGTSWTKLSNGLPAKKGKMAIEVSRSNSNKIYALVESDTEKELGGLFTSEDAGKSFNRVSTDHRLTQRAWYYIEIAVDPRNENVLYVFNSPGLKSIDGGKSWTNITGTHGDYHQLWINPDNPQNMVIANDGGAAISFNGGKIWSSQDNQPTAQFYRVNADNQFPYHLYGGQQDNSSVVIASRNPGGYSISEREWTFSAGSESAFLAFDPDNPKYVFGGSYQGTINVQDQETREGKGVMVAPIQYQSVQPKNMKYRFNWNAPIIWSMHEPNTFYHAGNRLFKTSDMGKNWSIVSPDLTRNDTLKMGMSGIPYTNEGAGGENYGTIAYVKESPHEKGVIYTGSDDGLVYLTKDNGNTWTNITPAGLPECLVNSIEVSPHDKSTAYIACTRYKQNDLSPMLYRTTDYGKTWTRINKGIAATAYTRVIREDDRQKGLLYAGTETGFYVSWNNGDAWTQLQMNLPVTPITDLKVHQGNLLAATMGRAFWILDDLYMLRNYAKIKSGSGVQLYGPATVYRVSGGSILDGPVANEEEGGSTAFSGVNAPAGVVFYYTIPEGSDSLHGSFTITNEKGEIVRAFADSANPKYIGFPGGPAPEPVFPRKAGLNRFVWDQRYAILPGVPTVFIEGSYEGHKAAPGKYTATFKFGGSTQRRDFTILADPRIKAPTPDYQEQHEYLTRAENGVRDIHHSVLRMRVAKDQVSQLISVIGNDSRYAEAKKTALVLQERMSTWEDALVQNKAKSNDDIINYINRLSADYIFLKGELDVNIPYVTEGQKEQLKALDASWKPLRQEYDAIVNNALPELNGQCRKLGIERVMMPAE